MALWLGLHAPTAGGTGSTLGWGTRILHAAQCGKKKKILFYDHFFLTFFFGPHPAAYVILVPRPGIEPLPTAVEVQSLNHWTGREVPLTTFIDRHATVLIIFIILYIISLVLIYLITRSLYLLTTFIQLPLP